MKSNAVKIATNFKSRLVNDFVRKEKNACKKISFIEAKEWDIFVASKRTPEFLVCLKCYLFRSNNMNINKRIMCISLCVINCKLCLCV